jgi:Lipocalin-like domain
MWNPRYVGLAIVVALPAAGLVPLGSSGSPGQVPSSAHDRLIGAWKLVSDEESGPDGRIVKLPRTAIIMYTRDGHMGVQFLAPEGAPAASAGPIQYEQGGYEAYFGTYTLDEKASTVTHHVEGALVRSLIGKDLTRVYRFSGRQLILKSSRPDEHWTVVWEHY